MSNIRFRSVQVVVSASLSLLFSSVAFSAGFGGYLSYGSVDGTVEDLVFSYDLDYESDRFGVGVVFDTNVARDRLFNYRLELGYQKTWREFDDSSTKIESDGFSVNNIFGFSPLRNESMRLWMGPALRLSVDVFDDDDISPLEDWVTFGGGIGPIVGLNWHMGPSLSGSLSLSYQYMFLGEYLDAGFDDDLFEGHEHLVTLGISILFRTGSDNFVAGGP